MVSCFDWLLLDHGDERILWSVIGPDAFSRKGGDKPIAMTFGKNRAVVAIQPAFGTFGSPKH